jgi:hypothetical protein
LGNPWGFESPFGTISILKTVCLPSSDDASPSLGGEVRYTVPSTDKRRMPPMSDPTKEELLARIAELEKRAEAKKSGKLEFKVGEKGGVSVYGLGRFPVTLYYEQWLRLLDVAGDLRSFLEENKGRLKLKSET